MVVAGNRLTPFLPLLQRGPWWGADVEGLRTSYSHLPKVKARWERGYEPEGAQM